MTDWTEHITCPHCGDLQEFPIDDLPTPGGFPSYEVGTCSICDAVFVLEITTPDPVVRLFKALPVIDSDEPTEPKAQAPRRTKSRLSSP